MRGRFFVAPALLVVAACSSSGGSSPTAAPSVAPVTTPSDTAPATDAPITAAPTTAAPTTAAPTTVPVLPRAATIDELLTLGRPIVLAHTGGEDEFPGSTMYGFGESMAAEVDMLDFNVLLTGDGVLIVQHDETVDRTTNGTGAVAGMTFAEIDALDNAYWFTEACTCQGQPDEAYVWRGVRTGERPAPPGYTADDFAVPTFRELVERFPDVPLNVEIKGSGEPAVRAAQVLADELVELGREDATVVSSFDDAVVEAFHALLPDVEVSPGLGAASAWVLGDTPLPAGQRILQLPPVFQDIEVLSAETISKSHAAGYVIWVWPNDRALENLASYEQFLADGMDGLNVNFPAAGMEAALGFAQ